MNLWDYQGAAAKTAVYPENYKIIYPALGLAGEAGELCNKVKKIIRDNHYDRMALVDELGDCLWYVAAIASDLNVSLNEVARHNLAKLKSRALRDTLRGEGDAR